MGPEQMDFPNTFDEFVEHYGFKDKDEIYTNGSEIIPVFRVKQWLEHIKESQRFADASKTIEPTITNKALVSLDVYNQVVKERNIAIEQLHELGYEFGQKIAPTTKNNLGVYCIDQVELLKAMDTWDKFGNDPNEGLVPLRTPALKNRYVPYVKYDDMVNCVKGMSSVTPIRPKGHWIDIDETHSKCSRCRAVFEIYSENGEAMYCPNCGSDIERIHRSI